MLTEEALPKYRAEDRDSDRIKTIYNYLFMLVEQLRYSLGNISEDNFNAASLDKIKSDISEPIYRRIEDSDGNISTLIQTAEMLQSRISNAEGDISTLTQTAGSLSSRISSAEGDISSIYQTVNGISLSVANEEGQSTIKLIRNGIAVSSETIVFSGFVRFTDLSTSGSTTINGDNITTGSIKVDLIKPNKDNWISFSSSIAAPSLSTKYIDIAENVHMCLGSEGTDSTVASQYPNSIYIEAYNGVIFGSTPRVKTYKNGAYGYYDVITTANIADYISDVDLVAKFG